MPRCSGSIKDDMDKSDMDSNDEKGNISCDVDDSVDGGRGGSGGDSGGRKDGRWKLLVAVVVLVAVIAIAGVAYAKLAPGTETAGIQSTTSTTGTSDDGASKDASSNSQATSSSSAAKLPTEPGDRDAAPEATIYDSDGNAVELTSLWGKPTVVFFWTSWCTYCSRESGEFQSLYERYGDEVDFVAIDCVDGASETREDGESFIARNGRTYPVYYDEDRSAVNAFKVGSYPTLYLVDPSGNIVGYNTGYISATNLTPYLEALLAE